MASDKISQLPAALLVNDADLFPVVQTGTTRKATAEMMRAGLARPDSNQNWTKAQRGPYVALASVAAHVAIDANLSNNFKHTLTENTTLDAPSNVIEGQSGVIVFTQHAGAAKTLAFNAFWKTANGAGMAISAVLGSINVMSYVVNPGGASATCSMLLNVS